MKNRLVFIYVAFGVSFIVIITISLLLLQKIISIKESNFQVELTHEVKNQILKVQTHLIEAENNQRELLLPADTALLQPLSQTQKNTLREIDSLQRLTKDNAQQQEIIKKLRSAVSLWFQAMYATMDDVAAGAHQRFAANRQKENMMLQRVMQLCQQMDDVESNVLKKRREQKSILEFTAPWYLGLILLLSCFFQLISFFIIIKAYKRRQIHQKILEHKIKELNATNAELEQIAFVASHDLQEPLRKIRTFSDKLSIQYKSVLNEEGKAIVEKISFSSQRMQELLNDLINYTNVTKNEEEVRQVSLKKCWDQACQELNDIIQQKSAIIKVGELPMIFGQNKQLYLLFYNLIDNALKFSKKDIPPVINITCMQVKGTEVNSSHMFFKIVMSDNGIGFKKEYNKKIFVIFKRLHANNSPLPGKGIGLAICKKVMMNHNGFIIAKGEEGIGATFYLYFPIDETQ